LGDSIAVLRSNPVEFDAIGSAQGQELVAFVIPEENQRLDPGAKELGWELGLEMGRAGKPEVIHWRARRIRGYGVEQCVNSSTGLGQKASRAVWEVGWRRLGRGVYSTRNRLKLRKDFTLSTG
jgi:hypothetical protein